MSLGSWIGRRASTWGAALLLLAATPAAAFPVYFNGPSGFGVSSGTAGSAEVAGFDLIEAPTHTADFYGLVIPAPQVLSFDIKTNPTTGSPTTAQSRWSVTNGGDDLTDAWLVFFTPTTYTDGSFSFTYDDTRAGIDLQSRWALARASTGGTDYFYPAVFLGDVSADETVTFLMNHVIAQGLAQNGSTFILPKYSVGMLTGVPLPEPGTFGLLAVGLALAGALRRGKV